VKLLNQIAAYISYLTREQDARSLAQPIVKYVRVNILDGPTYREQDVSFMRKILNNDLDKHKEKLNELKEMQESNAKTSSALVALRKVCEDREGKTKKICNSIVGRTKKVISSYIKDRKQIITEKSKDIREEIKAFKADRKDILKNLTAKTKKNKESNKKQKGGNSDSDDDEYNEDGELDEIRELVSEYDKYRESSFYKIKNKCYLKPKMQTFESYHEIIKLRNTIDALKKQILERKDAYAIMIKNLKKRIMLIKKTGELTTEKKLEINKVNTLIADERLNQQDFVKGSREYIKSIETKIKKEKKVIPYIEYENIKI
jgi:hypothetical protein